MEETQAALDLDRTKSILESMLLVSSEPLPLERVREVLLAEAPSTDPTLVERAAAELMATYGAGDRGVRIEEVADGLQLRTPPANAPFLRRLLSTRPPKLTKPAMETLAVIAYRQPVTKPEIEAIRGVDVGAVLKALLERELIRIIGKSEDLGRPILYGTTKKFLELFGLKSLASLPTLREYNELDELHQRQVDELYEAERPKISDLAAKVAFLTERGPEAELAALVEAEATVERAGKVAAAVLAGGGDGLAIEARVTEPAPGASSAIARDVAASASTAPAATAPPVAGAQTDPTDATPSGDSGALPAASDDASPTSKGSSARADAAVTGRSRAAGGADERPEPKRGSARRGRGSKGSESASSPMPDAPGLADAKDDAASARPSVTPSKASMRPADAKELAASARVTEPAPAPAKAAKKNKRKPKEA